MPRDPVPYDLHTIAFPAMNSVTTLLLGAYRNFQGIIFNPAINARLHIDSKKGVFQYIPSDHDIPAFIYFYCSDIINAG